MSFKREGDDPSQLRLLKKRRVLELLANYIPEDEALVMRDGRFSCTICFRRPVFDTIDMLVIHRSGRKHLASLQQFYGKKQSLENEIQKRQHQAYLDAEENGTQVAEGPAPLLAQTQKITQNALLKTAPYSSSCRPKRKEAAASTSGASAGSKAAEPPVMPKPSGSGSVDEERQVEEEARPSACLPDCGQATPETRQKKSARQGKKRKTKKSSKPKNPEKRRSLEHYLKLKSSGWIQDGSGKWVKDENVEFDSDEEEPPTENPPPQPPTPSPALEVCEEHSRNLE